MAYKNFFNSKEISDAFRAAAQSNQLAKENSPVQENQENGGEVAEEVVGNNFLHRLHTNSQLLTCDGAKEPEKLVDGLFNTPASSPRPTKKEEIDKKEENKNPENSTSISVEIPANFVAKLNELFGEGNGGEDSEEKAMMNSIEISLPVWICELLYKASKKLPIEDFGRIEDFYSPDFTENKKDGKTATNRLNEEKNIATLSRLYDIFPQIPPKTIKQCARENSYDYEQTANQLLNQLDELEIREEREPGDGIQRVDYKRIVHSHCPRVITEEEQQRGAVAANKVPDEWYSSAASEVFEAEIKIELEKIESQYRYYVEMGKKNTSNRCGSLCSHYMKKAFQLTQEKKFLERESDYVRVCRERNSPTLDLHEMGWERALQLVKLKIDMSREGHPNWRKLTVITGHGSTTGQPSVIRGRLVNFLKQHGIGFSHMNSICGHRLVPVELGSKYTDEDWHQRLMTFHEYLSKFVFPGQKSEEKAEKPGYLAQHRLLDQVPELLADVPIPDYCAFGQNEVDEKEEGGPDEEHTLNVFIGPEGTVSPLHTDPRHNFFCQIRGRKFVRLISPKQKDCLYLYDDLMRQNTSQVDVERPDFVKFPLFANAQCHDFVVEQGECLFIPRGWFHHVRALSPSISVSIWFGASQKMKNVENVDN